MRAKPLFLLSFLLLLTSFAFAQVEPDITLSTAWTAAVEPVSVFTVPNGSGQPLDNVYTFGGVATDATIFLTLLDGMGTPVTDYPLEDLWLETTYYGLAICAEGTVADANTDENGETTFSQSVFGGGHTDPAANERTHVVVNGTPLASPGMDIQFNSPDLNGDLRADLCDVVAFASHFFGPYAYAADFFWDGAVDLNDIALIAQSLTAACTGVGLPDATPETLYSRLGIFFDTGGESYCTTAAPGVHGPGFAYLLATNISEMGGLSGWECSIELTGPGIIVDWGFPAESINFATNDFIIGLGDPIPWEPAIVLLDMTMIVTSDIEPVNFSINPASIYTVGPYPAYAPPGETCNSVAIWPSCSHGSAAVINGPCPEPGLELSASVLDLEVELGNSLSENLTLTDNGTVAGTVENLIWEVQDIGVDWLDATPNSGSINEAVGSAQVILDIDTSELSLGEYHYELVIVSNACHLPFARVQVNLTVVLPGPTITYEGIELAQDAFPEMGHIDDQNLGANHVRFDMGRNIAPPAHLMNVAGDSIVATFLPAISGAVVDVPKLRYIRRSNPLFDPFRNTWPDTGFVEGLPLGQSRWSFDLPDTGFLFPGDVLHYHLEGVNTVDEWVGRSTAPADLSKFGKFIDPDSLAYAGFPSLFVVRALPSLSGVLPDVQPAMLWWNDAGGDGEHHWLYALHNQGLFEGRDFDAFTTNDPQVGAGNGLGGRATLPLIRGYETIVYCSGDQAEFTISVGDFAGDPSRDASLLGDWLQEGGNLLLSGNHLAADLAANGPAGLAFLENWIGVDFVAPDVGALVNQSNPIVQSVSGNPIFFDIRTWPLVGSPVPGVSFDAVEPRISVQTCAEFLDLDGLGDAFSYTAASLNYNHTWGANVVYLPYDLRYVSRPTQDDDWPVDGTAVRTQLLAFILEYLGQGVPQEPVVDVPALHPLYVQVRPNPLNPHTAIDYSLSREGELMIAIYNVRGERVKLLVDDHALAGPGQVLWDGTDQRGSAVGSGVYFCRVSANGNEVIKKVALVK
jgi:hypothetical protein